MDKSFHYMIMVNQSLFQKKVLDALSPYKLTAGQPKVLDYLGKHNGCIQKSIATGCQIEPATLTGILSRMEEKKLIIRQIKDGNKRSLYVYLTDEGKRLQEIVNGLINTQMYNSPGISIALIFITVGIGFKLSPAPSHQWTPDVYEGVRFVR